MKVLHLVRKNTQLKASFIQNQIVNHIDFEPFVIFCEKRETDLDGGFADASKNKIDSFNISENNSFIDKILYKFSKQLGWNGRANLQKVVKDLNPDVIHLHYGTDAGIYLRHLKNLNIPKIVSFYGYDCFSFPNRFLGFGRLFLRYWVFRFADKVLAMSPEMYKDLKKLKCSNKKLLIHYHGVPNNLKSIIRSYEAKEKYNLLMLSYLDPVKGHMFVLEALKILLDEGVINFTLNIVGDGHYKNSIEKKVIELRLEKHVKLLGKVSYQSINYYHVFQNADIFLHPSVITREDKEGIPGALVEAMFAALPVITTDHGGIPYIVENDATGLIVNEWDTPALAKAIRKCLSSSETRKNLGFNARTFAIENLDLAIKELELEQIYKSLINQ